MALTVVFSSLVQAAHLLVPFNRRNNAFYLTLAIPGAISFIWFNMGTLRNMAF
jgi:hypothetical protein